MTAEERTVLMAQITEYGRLIETKKKYTARKLLEKIGKSIKTDHEQFYEWLEEA